MPPGAAARELGHANGEGNPPTKENPGFHLSLLRGNLASTPFAVREVATSSDSENGNMMRDPGTQKKPENRKTHNDAWKKGGRTL